MFEHVMIDIESTNTKFHAGVLTIGAVKFNINTGEILDKFYARLGYDTARLFGTVDAGTLAWWDKQDPTVKAEAFNGNDDPYDTATRLSAFCNGALVWGNGATFDISILDHWYHQLGLNPVWDFKSRDCRTVEDLAGAIGVHRRQWVRGGSHHNALDDAIYQAQYISGMWQSLTRIGAIV